LHDESIGRTGANLVESKEGRQEVKAPMHGLIKEMHVSKGDYVEVGQTLLIFEAMKMESTLNAEIPGHVDVSVKAGQTVGEGEHLLTIVNEPKGKRASRPRSKD